MLSPHYFIITIGKIEFDDEIILNIFLYSFTWFNTAYSKSGRTIQGFLWEVLLLLLLLLLFTA